VNIKEVEFETVLSYI